MTHTTAQPRPGSGVDGFNGSPALTPSSRALYAGAWPNVRLAKRLVT